MWLTLIYIRYAKDIVQTGTPMGDAVLLCHSPLVVDKKVYKDTIIDIDDKITAKVKTYSKESIIEYEMMSRDNRIGENTNAATSILNQYTTDAKWIKENEDNISLLRIYQGKEIDYQKNRRKMANE